MLLGLISPTSGFVRVFGKSLASDRSEILQRVNFASPYAAFPIRLTVLENLTIFARIYSIREPREKISELLRLFEIDHLRDKPVSRLSSGENTRVGLCKAFLNDPKLLLLDEPAAYLDPQVAAAVKRVLLEMQRTSGTTILYTSHNMTEVQKLCSRIIFLSHGRVLATGSPIEVTQEILEEDREEPALEEAFLRVASKHR